MEPFVKAAVLNNVFEGQMLEPILTDHQIPFELRTFHDDVYGNLFELTKGWAAVYAPKAYKDQIAEFVEQIRNYRDEADIREE